MVKRSLKNSWIKNPFYLIKLKYSEAFGERQSFALSYYVKVTTKISLKKHYFTLVSWKKTYGKFTNFFPIFPFYITLKGFSENPLGNEREHYEEVGQKTMEEFRLFPLWIYKVLILKNKRSPISKWNAGTCIYDISNIAILLKNSLKQSWS